MMVAAFVNRQATIEALKADGRPIHLVCAGTDGLISLEDTIFAGSIAQAIDSWGWDRAEATEDRGLSENLLANDQAEIAASLWRETESMIDDGYSLADACWPTAPGRAGPSGPGDRPRSRPRGRRPGRFDFRSRPSSSATRSRIVPATDASGRGLRLFGAS